MERGEGWLSAIIERRGLDREWKRERKAACILLNSFPFRSIPRLIPSYVGESEILNYVFWSYC